MIDGIDFWHWWVLAALLIAIEVFAPTTLFLWTGISAAVVGLVVLIVGDIGWDAQLLLFGGLSVATVGAWRLIYRRMRPAPSDDPGLNRRAERHVGRSFKLNEPIVDGRAKLEIEGILWKIEGADLEAGARVKVIGVDGVTLKVEPA